MEVRISAADGTRLPDGCVINVGVGEVQKQARYDPKKLYRFDKAKRTAKLDVYRLVGSCEVCLSGLDEPETHKVTPIGVDGNSGIQLNVNVTPVQAQKSAAEPPAKSAKAETSARARKYLKEQDVESLLTNAMRALLQAMPNDSTKFLSDYITTRGSMPKVPSQAKLGPPQNPLTVAPFRPFYLSNVVKAVGPSCWDKMYGSFPSKRPTATSKSAAAAPAGKASEDSLQRLEKEVSELRQSNRELKEQLAAARKAPREAQLQTTNFRQYYRGTVLTIPGTAAGSIYKNFPARREAQAGAQPGGAPSQGPTGSVNATFVKKPSVGSWLMPYPVDKEVAEEEAAAVKIQAIHRGKQARRDKAQPGPAAGDANEKPFEKKPSVGSWLMPYPVDKALEEEEAAAKRIQAVHRGKQVRREKAQGPTKAAAGGKEMKMLPSVGSWLLKAPGGPAAIAAAAARAKGKAAGAAPPAAAARQPQPQASRAPPGRPNNRQLPSVCTWLQKAPSKDPNAVRQQAEAALHQADMKLLEKAVRRQIKLQGATQTAFQDSVQGLSEANLDDRLQRAVSRLRP
eukprot:TRINITY_DN82567_c0_g1_i1.p1 TRINITY_DN82567_c0_g1~~TRINITY_DN82567_c0_g1_i1.p1  ORF type:complete len:568 (+),score=158.89 TRINITY_DN82567_c0_g1_i1:85-1788(+)